MKIFNSIISVVLGFAMTISMPVMLSTIANAETTIANAETTTTNKETTTTNKETALRFNSDGKFKILVIADAQDTDKAQENMLTLVENALDKEKPNLVVLTGDNTAGWWKGVDEEKTRTAIDKLLSPIQSRNIPFAAVFGNHDHEGGVAKAKLMEIYQSYDNCLAIVGEEMTGVGTYNLLIKDSKNEKDVFNLWLFDSGDYDEINGGYAFVANDQIAWYEKVSNELKEKNGGKPFPSILFQHIAVPEVYQLFDEVEKGTKGAIRGNDSFNDRYFVNSDRVTSGQMREPPCPPKTNNGQFASWKKQNDIIGAFFGHDHTNDFSGEVDGIILTSVIGAGFYSYGDVHGVRTIELDEKDLSTYQSESIYFEEIVGKKPSNFLIAKFGYYMYSMQLLVCVAIVTIAAVGTVVGRLIYKKAKKKKQDKKSV